MTAHSPHAAISEHGLADGCERCLELALAPADRLDDGALLDLVRRFENGEQPRTETEARAFSAIETTLRHYARLIRVQEPELAR